jgi:transcriptional adapter 2-alpha
MGRSRGNFQADEDPSQRSRRKKNASSGENLDAAPTGQGTSDGKNALYHCNYCNKDITGKIRIKCAVCSDFDLCVECFSVGAEVKPHKSNHSYRVMDNLSFPLICPDWNADEEMLLLEAMEMYGMGNWTEIGDHVGTKSKEACIEHYNTAYMNSPCFPLPDMTHVVGKNRKELLAMAKSHAEDKKGHSLLADIKLKEETPFSPSRVKIEDSHKLGGGPAGRLLSGTTAIKRVSSNMVQVKDSHDSVKLEDHLSGRSFGGNKPKQSKDEGPSLMDISGYNPKRQEFDPEYDNDVEQLLADMEFKEADNDEEHELKLRILRIYAKRLDERKRRKDFIIERDLLHHNRFEKDLSEEEKSICRRYDVFMRFHSKEEHEELLNTVISEHRILKRIQQLTEARAAGCHSSVEADAYLEKKIKREGEESGRRINAEQTIIDSDSKADLLSEPEKRLCREIRILPLQYLKMQEVISVQIFSGKISKKSDAYSLFNIEPSKVDRVYDMLARKGIIAQL